ncbi:MAG: peptidoglycan-associated lipoprotein Pal [Gemmatimonas sp.]
MPRLSRFAVLFVALPLALGACKKKKPVTEPAPVPAAPPTSTPAPAPRNDPPPAPAPTEDPNAVTARVREVNLETVYFEYDSDAIRADAQATLDKKIPLLVANPAVRLQIAGHCDNRGTDEYNLALGRRRAEMVKRYLTDRGVDAARIETISFGAERPAVQGEGESVWEKNRRDEFQITAGGSPLKER